MSVDLHAAAAEWLADRRARGYRLADHDWLVASFLDGLAARGVTTITVADTMAFAQQRPGTDRRWQAARLRVVRGLAAHVHERTAIAPSDLDISIFDAELIGDFLTMLEQRRGNGARTRNARLAAVHSLFSHAALLHPEHAELIARVLAIPRKNTDRQSSATSPKPKWRRCWPAPTAPRGQDAVTTCSCSSWSRPGCESPRSRP